MKNYEKYADEIREFDGKHFCVDFVQPHILGECSCSQIDCGRCSMLQLLWLLEDYKEPEIDWSKVEVDTPILVRHNENLCWIRRHFAKYENGKVYVWDDGGTSWSETKKSYWKYAKLAETEGEK